VQRAVDGPRFPLSQTRNGDQERRHGQGRPPEDVWRADPGRPQGRRSDLDVVLLPEGLRKGRGSLEAARGHVQRSGRGQVLLLLLQLPRGHEDPLTGAGPTGGRRPGDAAIVPILLLVSLLWGGSYPAIKATQGFFPPIAFATFRCTVAAITLVLVGLAGGALRSALRRREWGVVSLLGLLGTTL